MGLKNVDEFLKTQEKSFEILLKTTSGIDPTSLQRLLDNHQAGMTVIANHRYPLPPEAALGQDPAALNKQGNTAAHTPSKSNTSATSPTPRSGRSGSSTKRRVMYPVGASNLFKGGGSFAKYQPQKKNTPLKSSVEYHMFSDPEFDTSEDSGKGVKEGKTTHQGSSSAKKALVLTDAFPSTASTTEDSAKAVDVKKRDRDALEKQKKQSKIDAEKAWENFSLAKGSFFDEEDAEESPVKKHRSGRF